MINIEVWVNNVDSLYVSLISTEKNEGIRKREGSGTEEEDKSRNEETKQTRKNRLKELQRKIKR